MAVHPSTPAPAAGVRHVDLLAADPPWRDPADQPRPWWYEPDIAPDLLGGRRPDWMAAAEWSRFNRHFGDLVNAEILADRPTWMRPDWWQTGRTLLLAELVDERFPSLHMTVGEGTQLDPGALSDDALSARRRRRILNDALPGRCDTHPHRRRSAA